MARPKVSASPSKDSTANLDFEASEGEKTHRSVDLLGHAHEYLLTRFASAEDKNVAINCPVEGILPRYLHLYLVQPPCATRCCQSC